MPQSVAVTTLDGVRALQSINIQNTLATPLHTARRDHAELRAML
jgi:hypothetical protein